MKGKTNKKQLKKISKQLMTSLNEGWTQYMKFVRKLINTPVLRINRKQKKKKRYF